MTIVKYILAIAISLAIGGIIVELYHRLNRKMDGTLTVDPFGEEPPIKLNLKLNIDELMKRKFITLAVDARNFFTMDIQAEIEKPKD